MRCVNPFVTRQAAFGCGQCMPCRLTRRRIWTHRLLLESLDHAQSSFVTLTYSEEKLPVGGSLVPEHFRDWLKRLRRRVEPKRIRFYGVGEYGDTTERPHYHAALFGYPHCAGASPGRQLMKGCDCPSCSVVRETWDYGHVMCGRLEKKSAQYIAGYVMKKMTHASDIRLRGRHPEFARMSLRPGLGVNAMHDVASEMMRWKLEEARDVPLALRHNVSELPLGRYLRGKLRGMVNSDEKFKNEALQSLANQMQIVRAFAWNNSRSVRSVFEEINGPVEQRLQAKQLLRGDRREAL